MAIVNRKLSKDFYRRSDVVGIARDLLGQILVTRINGTPTAGYITETEAYAGISDRASHAFGDRNTPRTRIMYLEGGVAYVYLIYGIHSLFNVVTNQEGIPHAVLVRSLFPFKGIEVMTDRRGRQLSPDKLCTGPGSVSRALGIHFSDTGTDLLGDRIWIERNELQLPDTLIRQGSRIGVDYAGPDALLPYRFHVRHPDLKSLWKL